MKQVLLSAGFLFIAATGFQSCQKEISAGDIVIPNPPGIVDSTYLSKLYLISITGTVADTGEIITYTYDNQKRVVSAIGASNNLYNFTKVSRNYYYNGNDTLPYQSRTVYTSANDPAQTQLRHDTTLTWHFYDNTGRNLRDSMVHAVADASTPTPYYSTFEVRNYSYAAGKIYGYRYFGAINVPNPSFVQPDQKDTASLDALGNIINNRAHRINPLTGQFELEIVSNFTYDGKQSAFSRLSDFKTSGVFPSGETLAFEFPQYSNRVTQNELHSIGGGSGGTPVNYTYTNLYNTNGLIKESSIYNQPPVPSDYGKMVFTYIRL